MLFVPGDFETARALSVRRETGSTARPDRCRVLGCTRRAAIDDAVAFLVAVAVRVAAAFLVAVAVRAARATGTSARLTSDS